GPVAPFCSPSPTAEARPLKRRKSRFESAGEHRAPFSPGGCKPPDCEIGGRRREVRVLGSPPNISLYHSPARPYTSSRDKTARTPAGSGKYVRTCQSGETAHTRRGAANDACAGRGDQIS